MAASLPHRGDPEPSAQDARHRPHPWDPPLRESVR